MREIKFRALVEDRHGVAHRHWEYYEPLFAPAWLDSHINILCKDLQFTGLKDKHGNQIFEGDLIRVVLPIRKEVVGHEMLGDDVVDVEQITLSEKVVIGEVRIMPKTGTKLIVRKVDPPDEDGIIIGRYLKIKKTDEVIGNIYENPELLKP